MEILCFARNGVEMLMCFLTARTCFIRTVALKKLEEVFVIDGIT